MKLKVEVEKKPKHSETLCGVGWLNSDEIISASDDHQLLKWNIGKFDAQSLPALKRFVNGVNGGRVTLSKF
uniref:Uncharacterized protein n=1 Tax=Panagrolaimus davidi TaxID=227884 RepID=A0A914QF01_9BILA